MTATWEIKQLDSCCEFRGGGTPSKQQANFWGGDVMWVSPKDMKAGVINQTIDKISKRAIAESAAKWIPKDSILVVVRSGILSRTIPIARAGKDLTVNQDLKAIIPNSSVDPEYLYYFLRASESYLLEQVSRGATVHKLDMATLRNLGIPLPHLDEQKRIVSILDQAFKGLERARANAEANLESARELYESSLGSVFRGERDDWTNTDIASLVSAGILEKPLDGNHGEIHPKKSDFQITGTPFIMASDLKNGEVDQENCYFITKTQAETLRKGFARDGDVLLSHKGTIGRSAILRTSLDYVVLTPQVTYYRVLDKSKLLPDFVYHYFHSSTFLREMTRIANAGSTRAYIGITKQLELPISFPDVIEQQRLIERFKRMFVASEDAKSAYEIQLNDLSQLKQSLLQKAFSGELT